MTRDDEPAEFDIGDVRDLWMVMSKETQAFYLRRAQELGVPLEDLLARALSEWIAQNEM
jgi:hypothetical protein